MDLSDLPPERIFEEWKKLLLKGKTISSGLAFLKDTGALSLFPELEALVDCPQTRVASRGRCLGPYITLPGCFCP